MRSKSLSSLANIHGHAVLSLVTKKLLLQWNRPRRIINLLVNVRTFICWFQLFQLLDFHMGWRFYERSTTNKEGRRAD